MKNKWYVLLGIVLSLFSILIVSPIYIDGIKEGIKTGIENSKENVDWTGFAIMANGNETINNQ